MVDERALNAVQVVITQWVPAQMAREVALNSIEAYEAALWRPIEEAPRDGRDIFIHVHGYTFQPGLVSWKGGGWLEPGRDSWDAEFLKDEGAMFRTIDPPKQTQDKETPHALTE